jgi:hypothetical protein
MLHSRLEPNRFKTPEDVAAIEADMIFLAVRMETRFVGIDTRVRPGSMQL